MCQKYHNSNDKCIFLAETPEANSQINFCNYTHSVNDKKSPKWHSTNALLTTINFFMCLNVNDNKYNAWLSKQDRQFWSDCWKSNQQQSQLGHLCFPVRQAGGFFYYEFSLVNDNVKLCSDW